MGELKQAAIREEEAKAPSESCSLDFIEGVAGAINKLAFAIRTCSYGRNDAVLRVEVGEAILRLSRAAKLVGVDALEVLSRARAI